MGSGGPFKLMGITSYPNYESNICRIATGSYTGDGSTGQAITGVGFRPKYVKIWTHPTALSSEYIFEKLDQSWGDWSYYHIDVVPVGAGDHAHRADGSHINSLDADGFTVDDAGADLDPNANGVVYDYLALG